MKRFINQFGQDRIKRLLADREFIGDNWMEWLIEEKIPFNIRIRNNSYTVNRRGEHLRVDHLFRGLKPGEMLNINDARLLGACSVYLSGLRLSDGQLLIVANASFNPKAIEEYGLRWEIETLFGCLKGQGFTLEDTRVVGYLRLKKLFSQSNFFQQNHLCLIRFISTRLHLLITAIAL
jgi:hypothetical protein